MGYKKQSFIEGQILGAAHMNHIEAGIAAAVFTVNGVAPDTNGNVELGSGLPEISETDEGKFLRVVDGAWVAVALTDVSEVGM